ncbi:TonB-dependent receptor [Spongiibacter sp. KMU-158]|uniref:TonB-dependent receptor n=1 Tax=Spongiibacter pelagi TaxID=2760804 RepID=A0A927C2M0_9GAMM|nr:TonB-dependent receptor [Spongiibacter pelagi]MBD2858892.1 TonB-dependent receptor [Spongiibacter pelagi]
MRKFALLPLPAAMLLALPLVTQAESKLQLEEVIVTAQKRSESLGDVPVSVTAVSAEKLNEAGIENLSDLSEYTPNFKMVKGGLAPNVYMRGIGSGSNLGFEMSVGIFSDGIHLGRAQQTRAAFMDVQRVEVLRGPQSILFGKNAIAGAINVISATPGDEFEGMVSGIYGVELENREGDIVLSSPLTDTLGARLAVRYREDEGYIYNEQLDRDDGGSEETSARLVVSWTPSDLVDTTLKLEKTELEQIGRTLQITHPSALTGCSGENTSRDRIRNSDADERVKLENYNGTLNVDVHMDAGTFTSVTGFTGFENDEVFDPDSSSFNTSIFDGIEKLDQFSQELRFASPGGEFMDYIGGVFYQESEVSSDVQAPLRVRTGAVQDTGVCALNTQQLVSADLDRKYYLDSQAWSAFTQLTFNFNERWRSTVGVRYVSEHKEGQRIFNLYESGTTIPVNPVSALIFDQLNVGAHELQGERDSNVVLPLVNMQLDLFDNIMAYASYTRGAKSGGYDAQGNNDKTGPTGGATTFEFDDEIANAWEIGAKMRLLDGAADLNLALYRVEYDDMQVSVFDGVAGFSVTNAGQALTQGIELDGRMLAARWLMFTGSLAYLDFEWLKYEQGPCYPGSPEEDPNTGTCNFEGKVNQQTPKWTGSLSTIVTLPLGDAHMLEMAADVNFRDEHYISGDLDPRGLEDAVTKYNARVRVFDNADTWWLSLVGKNLSDELVMGFGGGTGLDVGGYRAAAEPPRSVYVEGGLRF